MEAGGRAQPLGDPADLSEDQRKFPPPVCQLPAPMQQSTEASTTPAHQDHMPFSSFIDTALTHTCTHILTHTHTERCVPYLLFSRTVHQDVKSLSSSNTRTALPLQTQVFWREHVIVLTTCLVPRPDKTPDRNYTRKDLLSAQFKWSACTAAGRVEIPMHSCRKGGEEFLSAEACARDSSHYNRQGSTKSQKQSPGCNLQDHSQ